MSGSPPETTHDRTQTKESPRMEIKIPNPARNETPAAGLEGRNSTATDTFETNRPIEMNFYMVPIFNV